MKSTVQDWYVTGYKIYFDKQVTAFLGTEYTYNTEAAEKKFHGLISSTSTSG
jgi:hypothetical protein